MGHTRLGNLPKTQKWQEVIGLLGEGAGSAEIAAATLVASRGGLARASEDPALIHTFWLLTQIPLSARKDSFLADLRLKGLPVSDQATLMEVVGAFADAVDSHVRRSGGRTDLGEMAQLAGTETLTALVSEKANSLFGTTSADTQRALRGFSTERQFGTLARDFFARLARRYLTYFLSRELSNHVGRDQRFRNVNQHSDFLKALDVHCKQASRIVEDFAGEWFSKTNFKGGITPKKASGFIRVAVEKIRDELTRGAQP